MRLVALLVALVLLAPIAAADDEECPFETTMVEPVEGVHVGLEIEERDCEENDSLAIAIVEPGGRTTIEWYDDERGRGFEVFRPPYFVSWTDSERGCLMIVYVFALGAIENACLVGAPPEPVHVPL